MTAPLPVLDDQQYRAALAVIEHIAPLDPEPDTPLGLAFVALADAVETYEKIHYPDLFQSRPQSHTAG